MQLQVIGGTKRGFKLKVPNVLKQKDREFETRPMMDRVKSSIFSIIQAKIADADVLDLFAGSGAIGIECLSRGAKSATFVDISKNAIDTIKENLEITGFESRARVLKKRAILFVQHDYQDENLYDIIFITPPWRLTGTHVLKESAFLLKKNGIILAEHPSTYQFEDIVGELTKLDVRKYGKTCISFFVRTTQ